MWFLASSYDFEESIQTVSFSYKQSTATVYIKIKDDNRVESTEAFLVEILIPHSRYVQYGNPSIAKIFIKDGMRTYKYIITFKTLVLWCRWQDNSH